MDESQGDVVTNNRHSLWSFVFKSCQKGQ